MGKLTALLPLGCVLALASKYLGSVAAQRLALILLPYVCPLLRQTHHMVVPLNGAECVAVVRAESHLMFCTISKQPLAGAPTCKKEKHVHAKVTKKSWNSFPANANARFEALLSLF